MSLRFGLAGLFALACFASSGSYALATNVDAVQRDEYGVIPDPPRDNDLSLPDPVLDRNWPSRRPGERGHGPEPLVPDEHKEDPFYEEAEELPPREVAPPPGAVVPPDSVPGANGAVPSRRPLPPIPAGPDGRLDDGTPVPEPAPGLPDVLTPDVPALSDMEREEREASPLHNDDEEFNREAGDPAEW